MVKQSPEFFMNLFDASLQARKTGDTGFIKVEPYLLGSEALDYELPTYIGKNCERIRLTYGETNSRYGINLVPVIGERADGISVAYVTSQYGRNYQPVPNADYDIREAILSVICGQLLAANQTNPNGQEAA